MADLFKKVMSPAQYILNLLTNDEQYPNNCTLLKKIILTAYLGRLQINGLPPDDQYTLADYLFDDEHILFDYTRLSEGQKAKFKEWLLDPHQEDKTYSETSSETINEYRGFTAQVSLNWWGRIKRFFGISNTDHWKVRDRTLSIGYQLNGIDMCHGKFGTLIGFDQLFAPRLSEKYTNPHFKSLKTIGNTKRVFITDKLVDLLIQNQLNNNKLSDFCFKAHPHAVFVEDYKQRHIDMYNYRAMQRFKVHKPWYWRLWEWLLSWFPRKLQSIEDKSIETLYQQDGVCIAQRKSTKEIIVTEKKPDIQNIVFCGGGPKIFGHVGVWKALNEAQIKPTHFAGSSAGAIMSLLCYLGCSSDEINDFFRALQQEHIAYLEFDRSGASDTNGLKTALDFAVAKKLQQIVEENELNYPQGKITFAVLEQIRQQCLAKGTDCGIGQGIVITTTKRADGTTKYYSLASTPDEELTEIAKISASIPLMYRPTFVDGEAHIDGSLSSNFPTEVFFDDYSTLLESEYANNLSVLAVQFENGTEKLTITKALERVYRENPFLNFIYSLISGVSDPASAWEQDRLKLRKYAAQSVIVDFDKTPSSFYVTPEHRTQMVENGYIAMKNYLGARYRTNEDGSMENDELMYSTFSSLTDLLAYCCYRGDKEWFEEVTTMISELEIADKSKLMAKIHELRTLYFDNSQKAQQQENAKPIKAPTFFGNPAVEQPGLEQVQQYPKLLLTLYPIFLKISSNLVKEKTDKNLFDQAHHATSIQSPFASLEYFEKITGSMHVLLRLVIVLIKQLKEDPSDEVYQDISQLVDFLDSNKQNILKEEFYGKWNLNARQCMRVLKLIANNKMYDAAILCRIMHIEDAEPLLAMDEIANEGCLIDGEDQYYLYPILLKLCMTLLTSKSDKYKLEQALLKSSKNNPVVFTEIFTSILAKKHHILLNAIIHFINTLQESSNPILFKKFNQFMNYFYTNEQNLDRPEFYDNWNLSAKQSIRVIQYFINGSINNTVEFSKMLSQTNTESLQTVVNDDYINAFGSRHSNTPAG